MREQSWLQRQLRGHVMGSGASTSRRHLKWLMISGAVALGMAAAMATMAIGPQSAALAAPARPLASCTPDPNNKPTVSVDGFDTLTFTGNFAMGQTITIRGSNYPCNAPLTVVVSAAGGSSIGTAAVTTDATAGTFQTQYAIPIGSQPAEFAYPLTVQVYDQYATPLAGLTLRGCLEGPANTTYTPAPTLCGPQTLIQDGQNDHILGSLELDAEQQIADLRGVANDTTNIYFSRGEIRADMLASLLSKINNCGQDTNSCASYDDAYIINYYAGLVRQERVDVAQLADNLYEGSGQFCIPGTSSCNWQSWKTLQCGFLVPLGFGALTGASQSDSNQLAYQNEELTKIDCVTGGGAPEQPSFDDFTTWAAAAILTRQINTWATRLSIGDHQDYPTAASAQTEVQQEYAAALDGYQEGATYLTLKYGQSLLPGGSASQSSAVQTIGELLQGLTTEFGPDILEEMGTQIITKVIEGLLPDLIGDLGSEALATADTVVPFVAAAVLAAAVGIYVGVTNDQLGCALQSAFTSAQDDNLYSDVTGNTKYTYSSTSGICPSGTVTMSQDGGVALLLGALMDSTMPDFTNLRNQAAVAAGSVPSDPVFVNAPIANPQYTIQGDLNVQNWVGTATQVTISHGWFVVNGVYQPDLEYQENNELYRAWIDGNQFLTFRVGLPLGPVDVQETIDGSCPGQVSLDFSPGYGLCVIPQGPTSDTVPFVTASFLPHPTINDGNRIAVGQMTGEQGSVTGVEQAYIRTATGFASAAPPAWFTDGITLDTPVPQPTTLPQPYLASYLLSQPTTSCVTSPSTVGVTGPYECGDGLELLYQAPVQNSCFGQGCTPPQESFATLHYVGAADDGFTVDQGGNLAGQVLANDAPTTGDQGTLLSSDVSDGNVQVSVVAGAANGTLNLTASTPPFAANGIFAYSTNGFAANSGGPSGGPTCVQNPVPGTSDPGYKECGGATASAADSFIYQLCYTVPLVNVGEPNTSDPRGCTYARASIAGIPQTLTGSPPAGPITVGDPNFTLPLPHSTGPVTYTIGRGSVGCSVDSSGEVTVTGMAEGSNFCIIVESVPGVGGFLPAPPVTIEFHIAGQLLVTASHADVLYGDPAPAASTYSFAYSGFAPPDTQPSIVGNNTPTCSTNYQPGDGVGAYAITCTIGSLSASTYTFESGYSGSFTFTSTRGTKLSSTTVQLGTFKVVAAPLAVTASHTDLTYSDAAPATNTYTYSYSGFKGSDTQASIVGGNAPSCSTTYQQGNNAGSYPINCTINTLSATNYTFVSGYLATNGYPLSSSAVQLGAFNVDPAPLAVTASHTDLTFGDPVPSSYTFSYSGFKLSDTQASVIGTNAPSCATNYSVQPVGGGAGNYGIVCALGTLSSPNYTFVSGYTGSDGFGSTSGTPLAPDSPGSPVLIGAFKVIPAVLTVTPPTPTSSVQYSDPLPSLTPTVTGFVLNEDSTIFSTQPTCTPGPVTASFSNAAGTVTTTTGVNAPAGTYTITCSGAVLTPVLSSDYTIQYKTATLTVTQENAAVDLTGSQAAVALPTTGGSATDQLTATVWDSAATGYTGINAESAAAGTIGDVTKMYVEIDIYPAGSCFSGTPAFAPVVQVSATSTAGVGTATYSLTQSTPGAYCVVPRVVGATAGSVNGYYTAPEGPVNGIAFYVPSGAFITGGGWVPDAGSSNGHGNFGFEAHYNGGKPHGTFVYVWRGTYNGQAANFIIKSNVITALTIVQLGPNSYQATLQGKCSYTIVSQANGQQLYGEGNDTFMVTVTDGDNGLPQPQAANDNFNLITVQSGNVQLHPIATIPLSKGDVVVHN